MCSYLWPVPHPAGRPVSQPARIGAACSTGAACPVCPPSSLPLSSQGPYVTMTQMTHDADDVDDVGDVNDVDDVDDACDAKMQLPPMAAMRLPPIAPATPKTAGASALPRLPAELAWRGSLFALTQPLTYALSPAPPLSPILWQNSLDIPSPAGYNARAR